MSPEHVYCEIYIELGLNVKAELRPFSKGYPVDPHYGMTSRSLTSKLYRDTYWWRSHVKQGWRGDQCTNFAEFPEFREHHYSRHWDFTLAWHKMKHIRKFRLLMLLQNFELSIDFKSKIWNLNLFTFWSTLVSFSVFQMLFWDCINWISGTACESHKIFHGNVIL